MEMAETLDTLIDFQEDRLLENESVEAVLRILLDRDGNGMFRARLALSDGSFRCTAEGAGAMPALAVDTAAARLHRRMGRRR